MTAQADASSLTFTKPQQWPCGDGRPSPVRAERKLGSFPLRHCHPERDHSARIPSRPRHQSWQSPRGPSALKRLRMACFLIC